MTSNRGKVIGLTLFVLFILIGGFVAGKLLSGGGSPLQPAPIVPATVAVVPATMVVQIVPVAETTAEPTSAPAPGGARMVVKKAVYGDRTLNYSAGNAADVTKIVAKLVKDDSLVFDVSNDKFGDPAYGVKKYLKIDYTFDGNERSVEVGENESVVLTPANN